MLKRSDLQRLPSKPWRVVALLAAALGLSVEGFGQTGPSITSIAMTSPATLNAGDVATYVLTIAPGTVQVTELDFQVSGPANSLIVPVYNPGTTVLVSVPTASFATYDGSYTVYQISVSYATGGTVYQNNHVSWENAAPASASTFDFSSLGFTVTGTLPTPIAPTLDALTVSPSTVESGGTATINYSTTAGALGPITTIYFEIQGPDSSQLPYEEEVKNPTAANGVFSLQVPTYWAAGSYQIVRVVLEDPGGGVAYSATPPLIAILADPQVEIATAPFSGFPVTFSVAAAPAPTPTPTPAPTPSTTPTPTPTPAPTPSAAPTPTPTPNTTGVRIESQPESASVTIGASTSFSVSASGSGLTYQWAFNGSAIAGATGSSYSLSSAQLSNSGSYTVEIGGAGGSLTSQGAVLAVAPASGGPAISMQPTNATIATGASVAFTTGTSQAGATFQWYLDGVPLTGSSTASVSRGVIPRAISGAASPTLLIANATAADSGRYSCLVMTSTGSSLTSAATLNLSSTTDPGRLTNLSCRAPVGTGAGILIAGFATGGSGTSGSQALLIRASGPALAQFSLSNFLPDPTLGLFDSQQREVSSNSGWAGSNAIASAAGTVGAFAWTSTSSHDSALLQTLSPGSYTAQVSGASGDSGLGLVEVYDDTPAGSYTATSPRLVNLSARIDSGTGANILIAGFYIGGTTSKTVLIRGSGPALAQFSLSGLLPDPQLQVFDSSQKLIASNTGWGSNAQISEVAASVGAFSWGNLATPDSALLLTLPPGAYTAQVSGASGDTGITLVEVYDVP